MKTLPDSELAALRGGSPAIPAGLELPALPDHQAIEDFLAWWFQQSLSQ